VALEEEVGRQNGHAVIAFKAPASERTITTGFREAVPALAIEQALDLLSEHGVNVLDYYWFMGAAHVLLPPGAVAALWEHPLIDYIEPRQWWTVQGVSTPIEALAITSTSSASQTIPWGVELVRAPEAWSIATGSGARVQIIDTGHDRGHEDLPLVPLANCAGEFDGCSDGPDSWHGTHVLGSLTARDNAIGVVGVAHGIVPSDVYVYGACESEGVYAGLCSTDEIIKGIQASIWFDVLSMSVGGEFDFGGSNAVAQAWAEGVVLVAAAGNRREGTNPPDNFYPAAYDSVVGVSGVRTDKSFAHSSPCPHPHGGTWASNHGSYVDIAGPFWALSTVGNHGYEDENHGWCGTSFATPHVAAAAALLREQNPTWSNQQIVDRLLATAEDLGTSGRNDHYGHGLVDVAHALGLPPQVPVSTRILGPTHIATWGEHTWTADPSGGDGTYSYEWYYRIDHQTWTCNYQTDWSFVGSDATYSRNVPVPSYDFRIGLRVTSSGETAWTEIKVVVADSDQMICPMNTGEDPEEG